jgi:hypothetical protein
MNTHIWKHDWPRRKYYQHDLLNFVSQAFGKQQAWGGTLGFGSISKMVGGTAVYNRYLRSALLYAWNPI